MTAPVPFTSRTRKFRESTTSVFPFGSRSASRGHWRRRSVPAYHQTARPDPGAISRTRFPSLSASRSVPARSSRCGSCCSFMTSWFPGRPTTSTIRLVRRSTSTTTSKFRIESWKFPFGRWSMSFMCVQSASSWSGR